MQIYNTLTKRKEAFEPVVPGHVGIYVCGPTVYKPSHIGHAVGPIIFDTIKRYLVHKGYKVKLVINITDVDDKLIAEAATRKIGIEQLASEITLNYFHCLDALGVLGVDEFPRATENIDKIIDLIQRLLDKQAAYVVDGDVYFDHTVARDYGKLSGRRIEQALAGTRELAGKARHSADFVLWKAAKASEPSWVSPWGSGRPGWHIECSAMSMALLGETFDIHGGGIDLMFPHHENEIAQSEAATGRPFAKYWMHNGLTRVQTKLAGGELSDDKMSKSLGNIRTISKLLNRYSGETIRTFVLSTHYRRPLDFSDEQLVNTERALKNFYRLFERIQRITGQNVYDSGEQLHQLYAQTADQKQRALVSEVLDLRVQMQQSMEDDFNTAGAIATLHDLAGVINRYIDANHLEAGASEMDEQLLASVGRSLVANARILGLFQTPPAAQGGGELEAKLIEMLISLREQVRSEKNYALADRIRDELSAIGITLEDGGGGTAWRKE